MSSYLFFIMTTYLVINLFNKYPNKLSTILVAIVCGLGFLIKQNIIFSLIFFYLLLFFNKSKIFKLTIIDKFSRALLFIIFYFLPIIITEVLMYWIFDELIITNFINNYIISSHISKEYFHKTPVYFIQTLFIAFGLLLPLFFIGLFSFIRKRYNIGMLLCFFISAFIPIVTHIYYSPRFTFYLFPFIIPIAILGLRESSFYVTKKLRLLNSKKIMILIVIFYVLINNIVIIFSDIIRGLLGFWPKIIPI